MHVEDMEDKELEFIFEGLPVGLFQGPQFPVNDGRYRYEPYRGPGHYGMQTELRKAGSARCSYDSGDARVFFIVRACPEYGVLQLADFQRVPIAGD